MEFRQLGTPQQSHIVSMRLKKADEGVEIQFADGPIRSPILQRVPRMGSAKNKRVAVCILEIIRILGLIERPED